MGNRGFWHELRRRHVYRVAVAYVIVGWILIQVVTQVFPVFHLPDWIDQTVVLLILIGFPIALVLAWAFDATPQGILRTDAMPDAADAGTMTPRRSRRAGTAVGLIGVLIALIAGGAYWHFGRGRSMAPPHTVAAVSAPGAAGAHGTSTRRGGTTPQTSVAKTLVIATQPIPAKSIAVLPFENLSDDKKNAYFASGMQDMILTKLADIGDLKVIARTSTESYGSRPDDLKTIARQLGVATILEGSVQKAGNQVLINVQLIDANTNAHLWAEAYTRTLENIFDVEGEVAQKVAEALDAKLTSAETARISTPPTQNPQAYDLYLQGEFYLARGKSSFLKTDFESAIQKYQAATKLDPQFALAWVQLADAQVWQLRVNGEDGSKLAAQAKLALDRALALAPNLAEAHLVQGVYRLFVLNDLDGALAAANEVLAIQPQDSDAYFEIGVIHETRGQWNAAIKAFQHAGVLDPRNVKVFEELPRSYMAFRRYAEAEQAFQRALAINPSSVADRLDLAQVYLLSGNLDRALAVLDDAPASEQDHPYIVFIRTAIMFERRDYAAARQLVATLKPGGAVSAGKLETLAGDIEWAAGNKAEARTHYLRAAALMEKALKQNKDRSEQPGDLGWIYARLGRTRDALAQGQLGIKLHPMMDKDVSSGTQALLGMAQIQAQVGHVADAVATLDRLLAMPTGFFISGPQLKLDPTWDPIRNDPRFQALLKKYAKAEPAAASSGAGSG